MGTGDGTPGRMYSELADWFHLITAPEEYAEEAALFARLLRSVAPAARTLLELGSGGGNNAWHLKRTFTCTLTDLSPAMLAVSRRINPECEHLVGDMRSLRLGRTFDAVFVHDAVMYLTDLEDLRRAAETAAAHLGPGGAVLFVPDWTRETFQPRLDTGGNDGPDGRAARYIEITADPDPADNVYTTDWVYALREADGQTRLEYDHHKEGLFTLAEWQAVLAAAGFDLVQVTPGDGEEVGTVFLGRKR